MAENSQAAKYGIILVTASSEAEAKELAKSLVESQLAACVSLIPMQSIYTWQGELHQEQEWQLLIKTELAQFDTISALIQELHSYQVPEIIAIPLVAGFDPYLQWISAQVT
ncbi:divalent-cation tolerance protein CutA [Aliterella atlantica]|uniref:Cation tolerance protein CutA n=1 Tax=Aliterella atlantica CENA595 TaxID=1618023 RepID=A0A0D8ZTS9_9CYAN|nr:divalent-cation tolerance protein CutA [Aliterella atlantica]KJH71772.1 cation tolerance protein CutA [Aliterella atlantica CENA595]